MRQYEMCEITVNGNTPKEAWAAAALEAVFTCGEITHKVRGFVAGEGIYKVRFLPEIAGSWHYRIWGEAEKEGILEVAPAAEGSHGRVKAVDCHFEYQDGSFYYPFGTTVYALVHQEDELLAQSLQTLETAPFNKIRFCIFPKHYDFNHNEPKFYVFERNDDGSFDVKRPCFAYYDRLEEVILKLQKMGIECDLILFHPYDRWGFSKFGKEQDLQYLDYLLRRLSAMPNVWWSMANEWDLMPEKTVEHWECIENYLAEKDSYHHLLGNHNCFLFWDHTRKNVTHASLQSKMLSRIYEWRSKYGKPVCIDECCYEGNIVHPWGSISGKEMTYRFWRTVVTGGYCTHGETFYDENEVLWWAKGGRLKGESPERIAFLKKIVYEMPGPIAPVPDRKEELLCRTKEETEAMLNTLSPGERFFWERAAALPKEEMRMFIASEPIYAGHVGEDVYLLFFDVRTCAKAELFLPDDKTYKIELIDVWNMTRKIIMEGASGKAEFTMPGKEGMAVIAWKEQQEAKGDLG